MDLGKLDKTLADKYVEQLKVLPMIVPEIVEGDTLKVSYSVNIHYFGKVVECLTAVEQMLNDPGVVRSANTKELVHGRCLIQDVILKLQRIGNKL